MSNLTNPSQTPEAQRYGYNHASEAVPESCTIANQQSFWARLVCVVRLGSDVCCNYSHKCQSDRLADLADCVEDPSSQSLRFGWENGGDEEVGDGEEAVCTSWVKDVGLCRVSMGFRMLTSGDTYEEPGRPVAGVWLRCYHSERRSDRKGATDHYEPIARHSMHEQTHG